MSDHLPAVTYTASGVSIAFGLSLNEIGAIIGATVAVLSFIANIYYKHQHLKLARQKMAGDSESGD